jgi:hypothetical protein
MSSDSPPRRRIPRRSATPTTHLGFSADLIQPPQSQITRYEDLVSDRIMKLDLHAAMLAEGFGISFTTFTLNPLPVPAEASPIAMATAMLQTFAHRTERVSLERRSGRWGLYFTREPALVAQERRSESVPIKDAPLDVRERFLLQSEAFFREYLALCEDRLGKMKAAVADGDRTLMLLANIRLE